MKLLINRSTLSIAKKRAELGLSIPKDIITKLNKERLSNQTGENNPNYKGGISKNNYHYKKIQIERYPERVKARSIIAQSLRKGDIVRLPCVKCGDPKAQAHHEDYSKPLDVIWLCRKHHREIHNGKH